MSLSLPGSFEKWIRFLECSWNHEYFGSLASLELCKRPEIFMIPWTFLKLNLLLIFTFYYKYLKYWIFYNLGKKQFCIYYIIVLTVLLECKTEKQSSHSQWSKQEACFARATQALLEFNHRTSVTSGEWIRCSMSIARASELGSCQSNLCHSWGYERLKKNLKIH